MKKHTKQSKAAYAFCMLFLPVMLLGSLNISAQISVAPYPITAGTFGSSFSYSNTQNSSNYANYYGRSTNDISYKFTLTAPMDVVINHCGSAISDTYLHLLDANGSLITYNDDYSGVGCCSNTLHSRIAQTLSAGTYYVISEGYSVNGSITTGISGTPTVLIGDSFQSPFSVGSFNAAFSYTNTVNTTLFTNTFGRTTNEVFYKFTLSSKMDVTITHCGSSLSDTYLYLLDVNGSTIDYNDDYRDAGACSNTLHSVIKKTLPAGTYYAVSEGYSSNGLITTNITGEPAANNTVGNTFQNPIVMGEYNSSFSYSDTQNTEDFTNTYGQSSNDVFYKFTLTTQMTVTINHCGSSITDTYLHLLDAGGNRIAYNDDYSGEGACGTRTHSYLKLELASGTYYVVSEGYSANGIIITNITGEVPSVDISFSYDASGNMTARQLTAPAAFTAARLKNHVVKYNKEGVVPDPGRDGSKDEAKNTGNGEDNIGITGNGLQSDITVYPNPTQGLLTISIPNYGQGEKGEIHLYDSYGKSLYHRKIENMTETVDLSGYAGGTYIAVISIGGKSVTQKIIKE